MKKLSLKLETLKVLAEDASAEVAGAIKVTSTSGVDCSTYYCPKTSLACHMPTDRCIP